MHESQLRRITYTGVKFEPINPTYLNNVHTSNNIMEALTVTKPATDKVWHRKGRNWGDTDDSLKKIPWGGVVKQDIKKKCLYLTSKRCY